MRVTPPLHPLPVAARVEVESFLFRYQQSIHLVDETQQGGKEREKRRQKVRRGDVRQ